MRALLTISFGLVLALVVLSAYIRLHHAGLGCADWPACYGRIGAEAPARSLADTTDAAAAYRQLVGESHTPQAWTAPAHRLLAGSLGIAILALTLLALARRRAGAPLALALVLLALTVFLAVLGIWSTGLRRPAVILGNLFGGFTMLGLLWWAVLRTRAARIVRGNAALHTWTVAALVVLCAQLLLGGLTSANFAARACPSFPDCNGAWWPSAAVLGALDIGREVPVDMQGIVIGGAEQPAIHLAHRLGAWLVLVLGGGVGWQALRRGGALRAGGLVLLALLAGETGIGIAAVLTDLPVALAAAHNALAAALLLALLWLLHATAGTRAA